MNIWKTIGKYSEEIVWFFYPLLFTYVLLSFLELMPLNLGPITNSQIFQYLVIGLFFIGLVSLIAGAVFVLAMSRRRTDSYLLTKQFVTQNVEVFFSQRNPQTLERLRKTCQTLVIRFLGLAKVMELQIISTFIGVYGGFKKIPLLVEIFIRIPAYFVLNAFILYLCQRQFQSIILGFLKSQNLEYVLTVFSSLIAMLFVFVALVFYAVVRVGLETKLPPRLEQSIGIQRSFYIVIFLYNFLFPFKLILLCEDIYLLVKFDKQLSFGKPCPDNFTLQRILDKSINDFFGDYVLFFYKFEEVLPSNLLAGIQPYLNTAYLQLIEPVVFLGIHEKECVLIVVIEKRDIRRCTIWSRSPEFIQNIETKIHNALISIKPYLG